jgi:hypothetical protein
MDDAMKAVKIADFLMRTMLKKLPFMVDSYA